MNLPPSRSSRTPGMPSGANRNSGQSRQGVPGRSSPTPSTASSSSKASSQDSSATAAQRQPALPPNQPHLMSPGAQQLPPTTPSSFEVRELNPTGGAKTTGTEPQHTPLVVNARDAYLEALSSKAERLGMPVIPFDPNSSVNPKEVTERVIEELNSVRAQALHSQGATSTTSRSNHIEHALIDTLSAPSPDLQARDTSYRKRPERKETFLRELSRLRSSYEQKHSFGKIQADLTTEITIFLQNIEVSEFTEARIKIEAAFVAMGQPVPPYDRSTQNDDSIQSHLHSELSRALYPFSNDFFKQAALLEEMANEFEDAFKEVVLQKIDGQPTSDLLAHHVQDFSDALDSFNTKLAQLQLILGSAAREESDALVEKSNFLIDSVNTMVLAFNGIDTDSERTQQLLNTAFRRPAERPFQTTLLPKSVVIPGSPLLQDLTSKSLQSASPPPPLRELVPQQALNVSLEQARHGILSSQLPRTEVACVEHLDETSEVNLIRIRAGIAEDRGSLYAWSPEFNAQVSDITSLLNKSNIELSGKNPPFNNEDVISLLGLGVQIAGTVLQEIPGQRPSEEGALPDLTRVSYVTVLSDESIARDSLNQFKEVILKTQGLQTALLNCLNQMYSDQPRIDPEVLAESKSRVKTFLDKYPTTNSSVIGSLRAFISAP